MIKKGDKVKILSGKDRGKTAKVIRVLPKEERVMVEGVNLVKKHRKARVAGEKSERITMPASIHISNVMLICPKCSKSTRLGAKRIDGKKVRICKKCQAELL